jgi:gliding motility-associated-like protein
MRKLLFILFLFTIFFINKKVIAQINITTGQTAIQLAQMLVGKGVTISKVSLTTSNNQCAKFFISNHALPFDSGVVLTTGCAKTTGSVRGVNGSNQSSVVSNSLGTAGDVDLEWLLNNNTGTPKTHDACVLEFDLVPSGDSINISYLFSSEEYNGFVCSQFNDVFGFFLTGPGIIGRKNLALVPNASSNVPVTINTINDGVPSGSNPLSVCQSYPGAPFKSYFQANANGPYLTHYGRTKELIAKAKVTPCKTYHLRLAIGDFSDGAYDSGIFLKAGSIKSEPQAALKLSNTYIDSNKDILVERCHPRGYVRVERNKKIDTTKALTVSFSFGGTATYKVDYNAPSFITFAPNQTLDSLPIDIIDDGIGDDNEIIWVKMLPPCAGVPVDSIAIKIKEYWSYNSSGIDTLCYPSIKLVKSLFADSLSTTFLWNTGDTSRGLAATSSGVYTSLAIYKNTCTQKDTFNVTIDSLVVKNTIKNLTTCKLDSITLSYIVNQLPISSVWSTGSSDSIIKVGTTGNYVMTCTTKKGCIAKDTSLIKYIPNPILTLPPTTVFCTGDSVLLTASADLSLHYFWSTGDTTNAIWVKNTGSYSVVAQANGCIAYDTTAVISKPNPLINFPTNIAKCKGDSVFLDASNPVGSIYTWNNGNAGTTFWVTASGQYIVTVDLNGCFAKDTSDIIFYDVPVLNLPIAKDFCAGDSLILNATTFAGTTYLWSTNETVSNIKVKTAGTYFLKASLGVCDAYDTTIVTVTQYPILNLQSNVSSCLGDSIMLNASGVVGTNYSWSSGETLPVIYIKNTGKYIATANLNGCITKDTTDAVFNKTPILNLPITKNFCAGDSLTLNATAFAGTTYLWSTNETSSSIKVKTAGTYFVKASLGVCYAYDTTIAIVTQYPILNLQTNILGCAGDQILLDATNPMGTKYSWNTGEISPTIIINKSGTYIVTANLNGCVTKDTAVANLNNTPILNLPVNKDFCAGDSLVLNATTYTGTKYFWSTGETTPTIKVKQAGIYFVKANLGVCDAYDTTIVKVTQYLALHLKKLITSCVGDIVVLDATNNPATTYLWNTNETTAAIKATINGQYIVAAMFNNCVSSDTSNVVFYNKPVVTLSSSLVSFCDGDSAIVTATSNISNSQFIWNNVTIDSSITIKTAGEHFLFVKANDCLTNDTVVAMVYPLPIVDAGKDFYMQKNETAKFSATAGKDVIRYQWSPASNLSSSNILQPTILHPFEIDTTYKLVVYNNHCSNYDFVKVITLPMFTIPNVFTPNGDNKNDLWEIKGIEKYPSIIVNIFDRYGRKVFTKTDYKKAWDGTYQGEGKQLEIGTYYYIIDLKNGKPALSGSVTILR